MNTCLIVGAGMAGITAARVLQNQGWRVQIADKGRNVGGRMATRRQGQLVFDHGAQFFTTRSPEFRREVAQWAAEGWVAPWFGDPGHQRYRSTNGMNGLAARLARPLDIQRGVTVREIAPARGAWAAWSDQQEPFYADAVIVTAPVPQAVLILHRLLTPEIQTELAAVSYDPCLALLVPLTHASGVPDPGYIRCDRDAAGPLAVISDNTKKGISDGPAAVTIHSTAEFARAHWDTAPEATAALMLEAARPYLGSEPPAAGWQLHRWRYSQPVTPFPDACRVLEPGLAPLVLAGDAFGGPRVEGAYLSGLAAARRILGDSLSLPASDEAPV